MFYFPPFSFPSHCFESGFHHSNYPELTPKVAQSTGERSLWRKPSLRFIPVQKSAAAPGLERAQRNWQAADVTSVLPTSLLFLLLPEGLAYDPCRPHKGTSIKLHLPRRVTQGGRPEALSQGQPLAGDLRGQSQHPRHALERAGHWQLVGIAARK